MAAHQPPMPSPPDGVLQGARLPRADGPDPKAAEALGDTATLWRSLVEHAPEIVTLCEQDGTILFQNRTVHGRPPGSTVGENLVALSPPGAREHVRVVLAQVARTGQPEVLEQEATGVDGARLWFRTTVGALGEPGPARRLLLVSADITEQKRMEDALRASETRWRSLVESAPEFILITDRERRVQFVNRVREGREPEKLLGRQADEFVPAEHREMLREQYRRVIEERATVAYELPATRPSGETVWYRASMGPILRDGQVTGVIAISSDITAMKRAEASLRDSEAKWRSLVEHSPDFIAVVDKELRIQFLNRPGQGVSLEQVVGRQVSEFIVPEQQALQAEMYRRVFGTGQSVSYEVPWHAPDGEVRWLQSRLGPIERDGQVEAVVLVSTDITERRRAEEQVRESEARWRSLVENAPDTILIVDKDLKLQFVNRLPPQLTLDQVRGMPVLDQVPEEFRPVLREQYRRVFEERQTVSYEMPGTGPDGAGTAWWRARMAPILRDGEAVAAVVITTDITGRKRNEDLMREREALLAEAERVASMGSFSLDFSTMRAQWSEGLFRMFGVAPGGFDNTFDGFLRVVHPEDRERVREGTLGLRAGSGSDREYRIVRPDGEVRLVHSRGQVLGEEGKLRLVGVAQDVTDLRRVEQERLASEERARELKRLKDLDAFKTQFINTAAHELGTPLTPIRLQLDLLQARSRSLDEKQQRSLAIVSRNVDRLAQLVQDVLEVARLQAGRMVLESRPVELQPLLADAVESFQEPARQGGLSLELRAAPGLRVPGDARRLTQVVYNLLSNALKFTPRGGSIVVEAEPRGSEVAVTVRDTGRGIKAGDIGKLFEPFTQVHEPGDQAPPGTGLGLFISKGIVELHGGRIAAASDGLGRGTAFTFTLPAEAP
ncbi:MAG: PAS domain S-box protein [Halobacteriales archaeon]|nr:PAS domain S-box protein [Halobacteriales archaeon]